MKANQYELAEPKRYRKRIVGIRLYQAFQPIRLPKAMLKHYREYHVFYYSGRCWACGALVGWEYLQVGHLVDKCMGGSSGWENIRPMCIYCGNYPLTYSRRLE